MPFDQYHFQELLTPSIFDLGVSQCNRSLPSPDFVLNDYIDAYLFPVQPETEKFQPINDSDNSPSQHQQEFLSEFDLEEIIDFDAISADVLRSNDIDIHEWISSTSFPSSVTSEDASASIGDEHRPSIDMVVPPSPTISSIGSISSLSEAKRRKLSPNERKLRKKTQNKSAAEKYRIKKKSERDQLLDRHTLLKVSNKQLKSDLEKLTFQVQQLKQLLVDVVHVPLPLSN